MGGSYDNRDYLYIQQNLWKINHKESQCFNTRVLMNITNYQFSRNYYYCFWLSPVEPLTSSNNKQQTQDGITSLKQ